ncbi:MAG: hypothetical protein ACI8Z7_000932 [Candidatus Nanohaloarchaea archaeon]|jgi:hypothetical protein
MWNSLDPRKFGPQLKLSRAYGEDTCMFRGMNPSRSRIDREEGMTDTQTFDTDFSAEDMIDQLLEDDGYQDKRQDDNRANWGNYEYAAAMAVSQEMPESGIVMATSLGNLKNLSRNQISFSGPENHASIDYVSTEAMEFIVTSPHLEEKANNTLDVEVYSPEGWPERPDKTPEEGLISNYSVPEEVMNNYADECRNVLTNFDPSSFYD